MRVIFLSAYRPKHEENRLKHEGDVVLARKEYYTKKSLKLQYLFKKRFLWMNDYIKKGDKVLDIGSGAGISKDYIRQDCDLILSDYADHPWLDVKNVDALDTKFEANSFDAICCSNMIHHIAYPKKFLIEMSRILKPGGYLLVQEINCSIMLRLLLRITRHEGWSFKNDVYNLNIPCNDEKDLWSSNNAIPNLLFDDMEKFNEQIPFFRLEGEQKFSELFIFLASGGTVAKKSTPNFPLPILKLIDEIDQFLIYLSPRTFSLQRKLVLVNHK